MKTLVGIFAVIFVLVFSFAVSFFSIGFIVNKFDVWQWEAYGRFAFLALGSAMSLFLLNGLAHLGRRRL